MSGHRFAAYEEIQTLAEDYRGVIGRSDRPVVGWFCSYTPVEILLAAGLYPCRIVPGPGQAMTRADTCIDRNLCPYVRTCLGEALEGDYKHLAGLVVVNSCDAMRRLYDAWRYYVGGDFHHLLDLPRIVSDDAAAYYGECLRRLVADIEKRFNVRITGAALAGAIAAQNRLRRLLRRLYELNRDRGLPLTAVQLQGVVRASTLLPPDVVTRPLEGLLAEIEGAAGVLSEGPRVVVTGSILENPLILELIEGCGVRVGSDDLCNGTRHFWETVAPDSDPLTALARHYLNRTPCPRMKDATKRFEHVFDMVDAFRADGVIFYTLKFCDNFLYDIPLLRERLEAQSIPSLTLEGDYTPGTLGRVKTRIEAFIEMLRQDVHAA
jgi:benzoyl-CoA reductase/2-hydroxyglutaryl-CoA dehydratase subunit BcrC/BadD/HgdB